MEWQSRYSRAAQTRYSNLNSAAAAADGNDQHADQPINGPYSNYYDSNLPQHQSTQYQPSHTLPTDQHPSPQPPRATRSTSEYSTSFIDSIAAVKNGKEPRPHRPAHHYVPPILRLPALLVILLFTFALIGAVEYAVHKLPHAQKIKHAVPSEVVQSLLNKRHPSISASPTPWPLEKRIVPTSPKSNEFKPPGAFIPTEIGEGGVVQATAAPVAVTTPKPPAVAAAAPTPVTPNPPVTQVTAPPAVVQSSAQPAAFVPTSAVVVVANPNPNPPAGGVTPTAIPGAFIPTSAVVIPPAPFTSANAFIPTAIPSDQLTALPSPTTPPPTNSRGSPTSSQSSPVQKPQNSVLAPGAQSFVPTSATLFAPPPGSFIPTSAFVIPSVYSSLFSPTTIATVVNGRSTTFTSLAPPTSNVFIAPSYTYSTTVLSTYVTSVATVRVATDAGGRRVTQTTYVSTTTTGLASVTTAVSAPGGPNVGLRKFPIWSLIASNYIPLILAILIKQFWGAIYSQSKLIEPFILMNSANGVAANRVMDSFYLSTPFTPDPILGVQRKHWMVFMGSFVFYGVGVIGPLSSEFIFLATDYEFCPYRIIGPAMADSPCWPPRLSIDPVFARAIQSLLGLTAIVTIVIAVMILKRRSGVYSDPSTIASVASLVHHPDLVAQFRDMDGDSDMTQVSKALGNRAYRLGEYQVNGVWRYGLVPTIPTFGETAPNHAEVVRPNAESPTDKASKYRRWKVIEAVLDVVFVVAILALLGIVVAYSVDGKNDSFNNFFNSGKFGPLFALTSAGTLISMNWKRLERDCHTLSVYHHMSSAPTEPSRSILLRKSSIPFTSVFTMLFSKHYFASSMAILAVLSDVLIVFLGAVPFSAGRINSEYLVAKYACFTILALMVLGVVAMMVWKWKLPDLPREPDTVGAVASYVATSRMLEDFHGFEYLTDAEMKAQLEITGKRYVYGWRYGTDGKQRYLVDQDNQLEIT